MAISKIETESLDTALNAPTATALSTASGSAPSYSARAWVNFNGTGTVAIRASGNVTSITDNGTGDYTVNFTTAMPDANYSAVASGNELLSAFGRIVSLPVSSVSENSIRLRTSTHVPALIDFLYVSVAIFR